MTTSSHVSGPGAGPVSTTFNDLDLLLLDRTADALTAYSGRPVMAETGSTDGVAWAVFGVPLGDEEALAEDDVTWQMGGPGTRSLGNAGGLAPRPDDIYECRLLWVIQVSNEPGERYLKLDPAGDVVAWSDNLTELLPFGEGTHEEAPWPDDDE